jgi:hypothetical protein
MKIVDSQIRNVIVYRSGARIVRECQLQFTDGVVPDEVEIPLLPLALQDSSIRVTIGDCQPPEAQLFATNVRIGLYARPPETEQEPDVIQLKEIKRKITRIRRAIEEIEAEIAALSAIQIPGRPVAKEGKPPPASPMAARVALEQFTEDAIEKRVAELRQIRTEKRKLHEQERELDEQLQRATNAKRVKADELTKTVLTHLHHTGEKLTSATLRIEYLVPGARWAPAYQVRLSRDCQQAEIQMRAVVCQRTGEDWREVRLSLSTASPLTWSELPELSAIRMGKIQPGQVVPRGFREPPRGGESLFRDYDRSFGMVKTKLPKLVPWVPPNFQVNPLPASFPSVWEHVSRDDYAESDEFGSGVAMAVAAPAYDEAPAPMRVSRPPAAPPSYQPSPPPAPARPSPMAGFGPPPAPFAPSPAPFAPSPAALASGPPAAKKAKRAQAQRVPPPRGGGSQPEGRFEKMSEMLSVMEEVEEDGHGNTLPNHYQTLRLGNPANPQHRSGLQPMSVEGIYRERLEYSSENAGEIDVAGALQSAQRRASSIYHISAPDGVVDVKSSAVQFDYTYVSDSIIDVPSDGVFHSIVLGTRQAECDVRYVTVPREEAHVYRVATLKNPIASPLLAGPAEVYVGDEYVLSTVLPTVTPKEEFRLGLGVEQGIKCARNTQFRETRSGERVVATNELFHTIKIDIANNLPRAIACEIRERIPQPDENAEVEIKEGNVKPPWEVYEQAERRYKIAGGRRWNVVVPAGETVSVVAEYIVKIFAKNELVGGNRREN